MNKLSDHFLAKEFIEALHERAEKSFKGRLEQAFVDWYVEAEFGHPEWNFTDGARDGGIDAVIWRRPGDRPAVIILQSKFSEKIEKQKLGRVAY